MATTAPVVQAAVVETDPESGSFSISVLEGWCSVLDAHVNGLTREQAEQVAALLESFRG